VSGPAPQGGNGRVGIVENWELRQTKQRDANSGAFKGIVFVVAALLLIVVGGWYAARPMIGPAIEGVFEENPGIVDLPLVGDVLAAEFADRINTSAGSSDKEIKFVIEQGETIPDIQENLVDAGLLDDEMAFLYAIQRDRVDQLITPGTYTMTPQITPAGIAARLEGAPDPPTPEITLDMRPGRRIEQTVAYLQQLTEETDLELDPNEFKRLARNPTKKLREQYTFLQEAPADATLEGFLYPGTYAVPVDITAEELVHQMLQKWDERMSSFVRQAKNKGYDFYDALIVASLVEREAKVDSERAKIAGVYWNRLDRKIYQGQTGGLLQADPTVIYATDSMALGDINLDDWDQYIFWDLLGVSDYSTVQVDPAYASFQTYQNKGLPDWPIVTPAAPSMQAALNPKGGNGNLFFYACPGSDTHSFAKTAAKHQKNIDSCS
jgi:peptidoglycan lytic transglycosylase G